MKNVKFSYMKNLNLYGDNNIQTSIFAVLSLKYVSLINSFEFSITSIETGKVKTGCQMSYRGEKYQNN